MKRNLLILFSCLAMMSVGIHLTRSDEFRSALGQKYITSDIDKINSIVDERIRENYDFYGLATFYNRVSFYVLDAAGEFRQVDYTDHIMIGDGDWFVAVGRFHALLIQSFDANFDIEKDGRLSGRIPNSTELLIVRKSDLGKTNERLSQIRYYQLWWQSI